MIFYIIPSYSGFKLHINVPTVPTDMLNMAKNLFTHIHTYIYMITLHRLLTILNFYQFNLRLVLFK